MYFSMPGSVFVCKDSFHLIYNALVDTKLGVNDQQLGMCELWQDS